MENKHTKSKQRVADHGEVFTAAREVNAMLDLVKNETERIESRFLEPACGTGNFLVEILRRKLVAVKSRFGKDPHKYEANAVKAITSIYGVELLTDNAEECRERLFRIFDDEYTANCKKIASDQCRDAVRYILGRNILCGDALTMKTSEKESAQPLVFSEWSMITGQKLKRRDYEFRELVETAEATESTLFRPGIRNDRGHTVFMPVAVGDYPATHYRRVQDHG